METTVVAEPRDEQTSTAQPDLNEADWRGSNLVAELTKHTNVDSDTVISVIQLMAIPDLAPFFAGLCKVDLSDPAHTGSVLEKCVKTLERNEYNVDEIWWQIVRREGFEDKEPVADQS